ncbi:conjugal transfer protein TraG [Gallibacterium anatis]|uniref:conjugal transfer protein TraG N-terminal domain-containing protein n=1 Tax=Gallibacterium anatis TaxID=750 RepID=UPI000531140C|nr:conjugal transfer protein TraG N-terminal domain-containing protein [Gallibacterium anatis]KGQ36408.1 conjugal transfer protein TraG [Gallibacterium anatis]
MLDVQLVTNSYFEYFLTLLGWVINNTIWDTFVETGLFATPFLAHIIRLWLKVREEGDDEGNKGKLLLNRIEHAFYLSIVIIVFTCMPLMTASVNTLVFDETRAKQCGYQTIKPQESALKDMQTTLDGQQAQLPLWWAFTTVLSKAVTQAAITAIPCSVDVRQLRFDVQNTQVTSPVLRQEITDFFQQCYVPARKKIKRKQAEVNKAQARDLDWIGSRIMVETPGLYDNYRSQMPRKQWSYDPKRDQALPNTGKGGFPKCNEWWDASGIGLKARILEQYDPTLLQRFNNWRAGNLSGLKSKLSDDDLLVRTLIQPQRIAIQDGAKYQNLSDVRNNTGLGVVTELGSEILSFFGVSTGNAVASPGFDAMRQALPMIQGFLAMALVISIPFIMLFSGYSIKAAMTITFMQFGLYFLTFWWELARWLDSWLLTAMGDFSTITAPSDSSIVKLVIGAMFIVLPAFFMMAMGKAGVEVGNIANNLALGAKKAEESGQRYSQTIANVADNKIQGKIGLK